MPPIEKLIVKASQGTENYGPRGDESTAAHTLSTSVINFFYH